MHLNMFDAIFCTGDKPHLIHPSHLEVFKSESILGTLVLFPTVKNIIILQLPNIITLLKMLRQELYLPPHFCWKPPRNPLCLEIHNIWTCSPNPHLLSAWCWQPPPASATSNPPRHPGPPRWAGAGWMLSQSGHLPGIEVQDGVHHDSSGEVGQRLARCSQHLGRGELNI